MTSTDAVPRQIAMTMPRLYEDFRLSATSDGRRREIGVVGTAYDSIISRSLTYVSTPITSGAALYAAMDAAGVTDPAELKREPGYFYDNVVAPNLAAAAAVADLLADAGQAVIAPAAFEARSLGWSQDDYMGLWLDVIERKATRLAMVDGWEFSNGGTEEYLQALLMQAGRRDRHDIEIVDARGERVTHVAAMRLMAQAVENVTERGFDPKPIARVLHRSVTLHGMLDDEMTYSHLSDTCGRNSFTVGKAYMAALAPRGEMRECVRSISATLGQARRLIGEDEATMTSSLEMAPGLVRESGRAVLAEQTAKVIVKDDGDSTRHGTRSNPE